MTQTKLEVGFVTYSNSSRTSAELKKWLENIPTSFVHIVNNYPNRASPQEIQGHNKYQDIGAYPLLISQFKSKGPYLIINDTLFVNHSPTLWKIAIKYWMKCPYPDKNTIWGDIRHSNTPFNEIPNTYLASWIFLIPSKEELNIFNELLLKSLENTPLQWSTEYNNYLNKFLNGNLFKGWHKIEQSDAKILKKQCYFLEHTISKRLLNHNIQLQPITKQKIYLYNLIRIIDRLNTRYIFLKNWISHYFIKSVITHS
jgi:hypothetical protein